MATKEISHNTEELRKLSITVRKLICTQDYEKCETLIRSAMGIYPHAPDPHNLIGVLLEKQGNHVMAMKHFRAAWALDPTYMPARQNLDCYGTFFSSGMCTYDDSDCNTEGNVDNYSNYKVEYDADGVGHVVRRD